MVTDSKWLVFRASSASYQCSRSLQQPSSAPVGAAYGLPPSVTRCFLLVSSSRSAPASLLSLLYGSCLLSQWELAIMSRDSPQSISPERRSRDSDSHAYSDANIRNFAPVARIMKTALPDNAKIAKEAKECMQECVSEFISFITSEGMHFSNLLPLMQRMTYINDPTSVASIREMSTRKTKNGQWRRYPLCDDISGV